MQLEDQVCTVAQSEKFYGLGIINAWLSWTVDELNKCWCLSKLRVEAGELINKANDSNRIFYPAFTVAELGLMLPYRYLNATAASRGRFKGSWFHVWKCPEEYVDHTFLGWGYRVKKDEAIHTKTEAEARAAVLIHLIETKQVTAEEINKRLSA
jgi:hypothetical protein